MSNRKKPEKTVPPLLARLSKAKEHALHVVAGHGDDSSHDLASKFEGIEKKLHQMKESLLQIEKWEMMVMEQLGVLDQVLDDEIFSFELESQVGDKLKRIEEDVGKLESLINSKSVSVNPTLGGINPPNQPRGDAVQDWVDDEIVEREATPSLSAIFHCLESSHLKMCVICLSVFPENTVINKRPLIYWWIGEGLVSKSRTHTAEEVGEIVFRELLNEGFIRSISSNSFMVYPWLRRKLIQLAQRNGFLNFSPQGTLRNGYGRAFLGNDDGEKEQDLVTVFNLNEQYLGASPDWVSRPRRLKVLQMGRWQDSVTHHIEAENFEKLLDNLGSHSQKQLKYLSLRGISRIETLPRSIRKLTSLQILDMRACHSLNRLPEGISGLKSLTHLDVSECYLLDSMPKGLQHLSNLQVLKGFVVSNPGRNTCRIRELTQLAQLRKLSIRVGNGGNEQLQYLVHFKVLRILTILWGVVSSDETVVSLPKTLIKLDLRSVPFHDVPQWLQPSELPKLEKLYIKGGKLNNLNQHEFRDVKCLRLKYLKGLHHQQDS